MMVLKEVPIDLVAEPVIPVSDSVEERWLLGDLLAGKIHEWKWLRVWQPHGYILPASLNVQRT